MSPHTTSARAMEQMAAETEQALAHAAAMKKPPQSPANAQVAVKAIRDHLAAKSNPARADVWNSGVKAVSLKRGVLTIAFTGENAGNAKAVHRRLHGIVHAGAVRNGLRSVEVAKGGR